MIPLEKYTQPTLAEIRRMKTHGQKRVRAIVEVFHHVHQIASGGHTMEQLVHQLCSPRVAHARHWTDQRLQGSALPSVGEIREHFILPLLKQIEIDGTERLVLLARYRLGLDGPEMSVRDVSRRMGLTRARVYQMLDIINDILMIRWPDGRRMVHELCDRLASLAGTEAEFADLSQFFAAVELFYPRRRRLAMIVPPTPARK
ncbi:MAG TPA: hypothetical protein DD670_21405 [Planctomycetaceae bacterium]|nr:hypothetical protein [Planctomycetaceae bacterium]